MMIMMMIVATQEGCKSTVVGSRLGQFQLHRRWSIVPQWKAIVTWAGLIVLDRITRSWLSRVNCIRPDCDMMRLCRWLTSTGSSRWAQFRNATKMCSLRFRRIALSPILQCFKKWTCLTKYITIIFFIRFFSKFQLIIILRFFASIYQRRRFLKNIIHTNAKAVKEILRDASKNLRKLPKVEECRPKDRVSPSVRRLIAGFKCARLLNW